MGPLHTFADVAPVLADAIGMERLETPSNRVEHAKSKPRIFVVRPITSEAYRAYQHDLSDTDQLFLNGMYDSQDPQLWSDRIKTTVSYSSSFHGYSPRCFGYDSGGTTATFNLSVVDDENLVCR